MQEKTISRGVWMVKESQALSRLTIAEGASDPDGKRRDLYTQARNL